MLTQEQITELNSFSNNDLKEYSKIAALKFIRDKGGITPRYKFFVGDKIGDFFELRGESGKNLEKVINYIRMNNIDYLAKGTKEYALRFCYWNGSIFVSDSGREFLEILEDDKSGIEGKMLDLIFDGHFDDIIDLTTLQGEVGSYMMVPIGKREHDSPESSA